MTRRPYSEPVGCPTLLLCVLILVAFATIIGRGMAWIVTTIATDQCEHVRSQRVDRGDRGYARRVSG